MIKTLTKMRERIEIWKNDFNSNWLATEAAPQVTNDHDRRFTELSEETDDTELQLASIGTTEAESLRRSFGFLVRNLFVTGSSIGSVTALCSSAAAVGSARTA